MQLENTRCKNCGAELDLQKAVNGVVQCMFCASKFTLPKEDITPAALKFLHDGESSLYICRFDDAYSFYKKAAELSPNEPEAYWGMAISQFKVQYIKDEVNDRLQPICHHLSTENIRDNANYQTALSLATAEQREEYERQANEIDYIKEEFYKLKQTGKDYDCFICVKVTDDVTKQRTADYKHADDIYFDLKGKGYNPFFSERELGDVTGADYEARILYALYTSECMIVVCGKEEYLHTKWVKNEYTRFLRLVGDEQKESDSITIAFYGRPIEHLPGKNGKIQGIDISSLSASEKITKFVHDHTPEARAKKSQAEKAKKANEEAILQEIEKQKEAQRELEERLKSIREAPSRAESQTSATTRSLLMRANQFLSGGEFNSATDYFNKVLDIDPESAEAWIGLMLATGSYKSYKELVQGKGSAEIKAVLSDKHFRNAKQYSKGGIVKEFEDYVNEEYEKALKVEAEKREQQKIKTSEASWREFIRLSGLKNDVQSSMQYLNAGGVKRINDSTALRNAYSYGNEHQKAYYDEYLSKLSVRVEQLKAEELKKLESLKVERDNKQAEYDAERKVNGSLQKRSKTTVGVKYWTIAIVAAMILFVVGLGSCGYACTNEVPMFGIAGLEIESVSAAIGAFIAIVFASVIGGLVIALLALLFIFLPKNAGVARNNKKFEEMQAKQRRYSSSQGKVTESENNISSYDRFIRDIQRLKYTEAAADVEVPVKNSVGDYSVDLTNAGRDKLQTVRIIRKYVDMTATEAKNLTENLGTIASGVSMELASRLIAELYEVGAETVLNRQSGGGASAQNTENAQDGVYELYFTNVGYNKIDVIKVVRMHTGLGLVEAKTAVEKGGSILTGISYEEAMKAKADYEGVGAQVGIRKL